MKIQEKVVFVTCEDDERISDIRDLNGRYVRLAIVYCFAICCPQN